MLLQSDITFAEAGLISAALTKELARAAASNEKLSLMELREQLDITLRSAEYAAHLASAVDSHLIFVGGATGGGSNRWRFSSSGLD